MKFIVSLALLSIAPLVQAQETANFTGRWRYEKDSGTQRLLEIEQKGRSLRVETAVVSSEGTRRLEVRYEIGGPGTTYKGLDGDEFRSAVRWEGNTLVFETVETEAGKKIPQKNDLDAVKGQEHAAGGASIDEIRRHDAFGNYLCSSAVGRAAIRN